MGPLKESALKGRNTSGRTSPTYCALSGLTPFDSPVPGTLPRAVICRPFGARDHHRHSQSPHPTVTAGPKPVGRFVRILSRLGFFQMLSNSSKSFQKLPDSSKSFQMLSNSFADT